MGFLDRFRKKGKKGKKAGGRGEEGTGARTSRRAKGKKVVVLSIDGTPYSFLEKRFADGTMPNLAEIADRGSFRQMDSVLPVVSSVQWATFQSGRNPGKHGIFGFVDREPMSYRIRLPNGADLRGKMLQEVLSDQGMRVFSMNVPESFPPREVNGIMIGGFLCPGLEKVAYPSHEVSTLEMLDYVIDAEPWVAHDDLDKFVDLVFKALKARMTTTRHYIKEDYDFFMVHFMETDRINHFVWRMYEKEPGRLSDRFMEFYAELDAFLGEVDRGLDEETELVVLSDHGFCELEQEVNTNQWLAREGFLEFAKEKEQMTIDLDPARTQVYSLIPGRFFINQAGREPGGCVKQGEEREKVVEALMEALSGFKYEDGRKVIDRVVRREDIYEGEEVPMAADVIAHPVDGFDLKAGGEKVPLYKTGALNGMHTFHDATFITSDRELTDDRFSILDTPRSILEIMGAHVPRDWDGRSILR